jgi:hypothetical protein
MRAVDAPDKIEMLHAVLVRRDDDPVERREPHHREDVLERMLMS